MKRATPPHSDEIVDTQPGPVCEGAGRLGGKCGFHKGKRKQEVLPDLFDSLFKFLSHTPCLITALKLLGSQDVLA